MTEEQEKRLREIASKSARDITQEDKAYIREQADALGVDLGLTERPNCKNCYIDGAKVIYARLSKEGARSVRRYELRNGVDVLYNGRRVNAATITDEIAERLLQQGFPVKYFASYGN